MATKSISQLDTQATANETDLFEVAIVDANSASGYASKKESAAAIADAIVGEYQYPLRITGTTAKTIAGAINELESGKADSSSLAPVATSGAYADLSGKPTIDSALDTTSTNAVENRAVTEAINELSQRIDLLEDVWGLECDFDNSHVVRLAGAVGRTAGSDFDNFAPWQRRRCILTNDGAVLAYYGETGYTETGALTEAITKDGTTYAIGTEVQVMVEQKPVWYKVVPVKITPNTDSGIGYHGQVMRYYVSDKEKAGFKLHPAFYGEARPIYLSAYEGSLYDSALDRMFDDDSDTSTTINADDKLCSIGNNQKPISGLKKDLSKPNCELLASRRGNGWHLESIQVYMMNIFLSMIEYATFNSQNSLGAGVTSITDNSSYNCSSLTGSTSSLGNTSGQASSTVNRIGSTTTTYTTSGKVSVSYRGQENPYGNIWKHIQSINFWDDGTMCGGQAYVNNTLSDFNESMKDGVYVATNITLANANGYAKYIGYSSDYDWLFLTSKVGDGASTSTIIGDYTYAIANLNVYRIALLGGRWSFGGIAGSLSWVGNNGVGRRARDIGGRLMYIPSVT